MSEDVPPYCAPVMTYVFACPQCRGEMVTVDHADLTQVRIGLLGMDWQCPHYRSWAQIRVREKDRGLTVERGTAPAVRT